MRATLIVCLFCLWSTLIKAETVTVAVAANFATTLHTLADEFERLSDHEVRVVSGSSGKLFAQIVNGAPFDVFLSADQCKPHELALRGLGLADTQRTYAVGRLAVWAREQSALPITWSDVQRIAIANPRSAPYGAAAQDVVDSITALPQAIKTVQGENVAQVYQYVATGAVDAGFVAYALLPKPVSMLDGVVWVVPTSAHDPIYQDLIVLERAAANPAAHSLLEFLAGEQTAQHLLQAGYGQRVPAVTPEPIRCP